MDSPDYQRASAGRYGNHAENKCLYGGGAGKGRITCPAAYGRNRRRRSDFDEQEENEQCDGNELIRRCRLSCASTPVKKVFGIAMRQDYQKRRVSDQKRNVSENQRRLL